MHSRPPNTNRRSRRRVGIASSVALAGGLSLAAAAAVPAGAATSTPALRTVKRAGRSTSKAGTAAFSLKESVAAKGSHGAKSSATVTGSGKVDFAGHKLAMTLHVPNGQTMQLIGTASVLYAKVPPADVSKVPGQKPWISITLRQLQQGHSSGAAAQLDSANSAGPSQVLHELSEATTHGSKIGTRKVNGVKTTEYRVEVDLAKVAKKEPAKSNAIRSEEKVLGKKDLPIDVWVGPHQRIRQISIEVAIPEESSSGGGGTQSAGSTSTTRSAGTAHATITFTQFGTPVQVSPPPASQVANITPQATGGTMAASNSTASSRPWRGNRGDRQVAVAVLAVRG